jgi:anaerobic magnesium-protoporphyrin IX monomethyl ester cyclase
MKITFLIPPSLDNKRVPERIFGCTYGLYPIPNIFILQYASILRDSGNQVNVIDGPITGITGKDFLDFLKKDKSDVYIFYSVNLSVDLDARVGKTIRKLHRNIPLIYCGPAAGVYEDKFLFDNNVYVARGEADYTLNDLISFLDGTFNGNLNEINGITYLKKKTPFSTPSRALIENLDELPFPARDLINRDLYYNPKLKIRPFTAVMTSRGCPYRCKYCVPSSLTFARKLEYQEEKGYDSIPKVTYRSAGNVIAEFKLLKEKGYKAVSIIDDEFVLKKERIKEICKGIKDLKIKWGCLARADHLLDEELVFLLKEAGCQYVDIGIESFNQEILDDIKKDIKVETFYKAVDILKKYGVEPKLNILIAASPLETKDTVKSTINEALKLNPGVNMFNICNPFPGTDFYREAKKNKWFVYGDYLPVDVQKKSIIEYPYLNKHDIERMVRIANIKTFFRFSFIFRNLKKFVSIRELKYALISLFKKLS